MRRRCRSQWALFFIWLCAVVPVAGEESPKPKPAAELPPQKVYDDFNAFCRASFGVLHEPLTTKLPGEQLRIHSESFWEHISENSACIAWETSLPTVGQIEFGATDKYGRTTDASERAFYLHVHYLTALETGRTYHYRLAITDEQGKRFTSPDRTFTTRKTLGATHLPGRLGKPPYLLRQPGTYVLTEDIVSPSTAINVVGKDIEIDLNGHTLTYDDQAAAEDPEARSGAYGYFAKLGQHGVRGGYSCRETFRLVNGKIVQGKGNGGPGYQPVFLEGAAEVAGITLVYHGAQGTGLHTAAAEVHHNVIMDRGTAVTNRHQGVHAIEGHIPKIHHNLVKRCRQRGLFGPSGGEIAHNEVYVDSYATNAYAVLCYGGKQQDIHHNWLFGGGYHAIGVGTVQKAEDIAVHHNFIHFVATEPNQRWEEYGPQSNVNGCRITWGGKNLVYDNNVIVANARGGGTVRGVWACPQPDITGVVFRNNTIKALALDSKSDSRGAVSICGDGREDDAPMLFENNLVISNFCNVVLGETYGCGSNTIFVANTFAAVEPHPAYRTIQIGFWTTSIVGHQFIDNVFEGGAGYDKVRFLGTGKRDFSVGWTIGIKTAPHAKVSIADKQGTSVFSGTSGSSGVLSVPLLEYTQRPDGKTTLTPHQITVDNDGHALHSAVTADRKQTVELPLR